MWKNSHRKIKLDFNSRCNKKHIFAETYINDNFEGARYHFIFFHSLFTYHKSFDAIINELYNKFGDSLQISLWDLYGHGKSGGERSWVDNYDNYSQDSVEFLKKISLFTQKNDRIYFIGSGYGATLILDLMINYSHLIPFKIQGSIYVNPLLRVSFGLEQWGGKITRSFSSLSKLSIPLFFNARDLSHDEEFIHKYESDLLNNKFLTIGVANQVMIHVKKIRSLFSFYRLPSIVFLSKESKMNDIATAEYFFKESDEKVSLHYYPTSEYDLFNSSFRDDVYESIFSWIKGLR